MYDIITNKALMIPVAVWAITQILKVVIVLIRDKRLDLWLLVRSGGMPSSHAALVGALATVVAVVQGLNSVAFAITAILAMIVMYDAANVRQAVGRQSVLLNRIVRELREKRPRDEVERDLKEFIGHTSFQVIIGSLLGILIAWLWLVIGGV
ncbi:divergent PAP2 family protein [Chloroflexota bacterium]